MALVLYVYETLYLTLREEHRLSLLQEWVGHIACIKVNKYSYKISVAKPEGKRQLERVRYRLEGNIKMGLQERGWQGVEWALLAQSMAQCCVIANIIMNIWAAWNERNSLKICQPFHDSLTFVNQLQFYKLEAEESSSQASKFDSCALYLFHLISWTIHLLPECWPVYCSCTLVYH